MELDTTGTASSTIAYTTTRAGKWPGRRWTTITDGKMDTFYYYKEGVLQRVEIDSKVNGKMDIWVYLMDGEVRAAGTSATRRAAESQTSCATSV